MRVEIRGQAFSPWRELDEHESRMPPGEHGACAVFVGSMRGMHRGARVQKMTLEHYPGMTERQLRGIAEQAAREHALLDALVLHRAGELQPGEPIVLVAAWSAHRAAAFAACREMMEALKTRATFWKLETREDGEFWVEANTPREG